MEMLVLCLGILAALAGLTQVPDARKKGKWAIALLAVGLGTQAATQIVQFHNATSVRVRAQREAERRIAHSLFAYKNNNKDLLAMYADEFPYLIGYKALIDGEFERAKHFLTRSIEKDQYVAASHYLLADITRVTGGDLMDASDHLAQSIAADPEYSAAYYARGLVSAAGRQFKTALADLDKAVMGDPGPCIDLNTPAEFDKYWRDLGAREPDRVEKLKKACQDVHHIPDSYFSQKVNAMH
jgi:tetratricopeptide (TPR) repeat protein